MIQKKRNVLPPPAFSAMYGKEKAIVAAITQCVVLPNVCPLALTWLGKISEIKTQITAPWRTQKMLCK